MSKATVKNVIMLAFFMLKIVRVLLLISFVAAENQSESVAVKMASCLIAP